MIGCGSNAKQQLGDLGMDYDGHPVEICLDAAVQQFACGPESTLVLTGSGNLFLTGRLNEFVFPKFTELQKNLSQTEQIIFMHISKASEIFIVTNVGNIYRSFESLRNKSLVFQRFYDYDSEENGPIWKLLKGFSFYAVLSKANKFFTTFSESGHHLKTFREISKFKNLRLLDIAVGDQHILVQGLPRSSALSATVGSPANAHSYMSRSFILQPKDLNANLEMRSASGKSLSKQRALKETEPETDGKDKSSALMGATVATVGASVATLEAVKHISDEHENSTAEQESNTAKEPEKDNEQMTEMQAINESVSEEANQETQQKAEPTTEEPNNNKEELLVEAKIETPVEAKASEATPQKESQVKEMEMKSEPMEPTAPEESPINQPTNTTTTTVTAVEALAKLPTPPATTPSPQQSPAESIKSKTLKAENEQPPTGSGQEKQLRPHTPYPDSSNASTPQTIKRTPIRNFSYEAAMKHDEIEKTSPELVDSLDTVEENPLAESAPSTEIQISTPTPPTEEDEQLAVEITTKEDALDSSKVVNEIRFINNGVDVTANVENQMPDTPLADFVDDLESEGEQMLEDLEQHVDKVVTEQKAAAITATDSVGDVIESKLQETGNTVQTAVHNAMTGARDTVETAGERMVTGARNAVDAAGKGAQRMADGARDAVDAAGKSAMRMASDAKQSMEQVGSNAAKIATNTKESMGRAMDSMTSKISNEVHGAKENISSLFQIKAAKESQHMTTPTTTPEDIRPKRSTETANSGDLEAEGEEDERTTASVNSNHHSAAHSNGNGNGNGNIFEPMNSNSHAFEEDPLDAVVERSKKAMQEELRALEEQRAQSHIHTKSEPQRRQSTESKGIVQQFLDGVRLSCRNEKAVQIEGEH